MKNLRNVIKAEQLFKNVKLAITKKKWKLKNDAPSDDDLRKACFISVLSSLENHPEPASLKDDLYSRIGFNEIKEDNLLTQNAKWGIWEYFYNPEKSRLIAHTYSIDRELVIAALHFFEFLSLDGLKRFYVEDEKKANSYINPLFLSDEDKKAEVEQIKTAISDKKILHEGNFGIGRVIECICYCQDVSPISDDDLKKFAELLAEQSIASNISEETLKKKIDDSSLC